MKNKTIYLLRHGETDFNKRGMVQGRGIDASLNEKGRKQAKQVYEALKNVQFDSIYTSSLVRTRETVLHFDSPKEAMEGFDEISWGDQEGVLPTPDSENLYLKTVRAWRDGKLSESVGGGESPIEVMERQKLAMNEVLNNEGETLLISMHGRAIRILICWLLNYPLQFMDGFDHQNCCYYKLGFSDGVFAVDKFNQVGHLS
ncbi:MAG: histidine phosphatase family protein [Cytophagales bacterium]|nr:histidine phosphatase family protein [Cytophagales bacterium]